MNYNITEATANKILSYLELAEYEVTDIYEQSFRALRKNEYILSEVNVELCAEPKQIDRDNVYSNTLVCTHVLKRYQ